MAGAGRSPQGILGGLEGFRSALDFREREAQERRQLPLQQLQTGLGVLGAAGQIQAGQATAARAATQEDRAVAAESRAVAGEVRTAAGEARDVLQAPLTRDASAALAEQRRREPTARTPTFKSVTFTDPTTGKEMRTDAREEFDATTGTSRLIDRQGRVLPPDTQLAGTPFNPQREKEQELRRQGLALQRRVVALREAEQRTGQPMSPSQARLTRNDVAEQAAQLRFLEGNEDKTIRELMDEILEGTGVTEQDLLQRMVSGLGENPTAGPPRLAALPDAEKFKMATVDEEFPRESGQWVRKTGPDSFIKIEPPQR